MKVAIISSTWIYRTSCRLDARPFASSAFEARRVIEALCVSREPLHRVTERIYHAGRESRSWVTDLSSGVPFLSSTDILRSDLTDLPLLAKSQIAKTPDFIVRKGWTLITRSGTIGRMAYCRPDMDGLACSEHVMRVVPDEAQIGSGFLFAYMSSRYGQALVEGGTYGSIIQAIEPEHLTALPIPRLGKQTEQRADSLVKQAAEARSEACRLLSTAQELLRHSLHFPSESLAIPDGPSISTTRASSLCSRMDAYYYSTKCIRARELFDRAASSELRDIESVAEVAMPGIFKRLYADDPCSGVPYITGADVFQIAPKSDRHLMKRVAAEYGLVVRAGMILIQEAGQLGGLLGNSVLAGKNIDGMAVSNNMIRLTARSITDRGYLFAVLSSRPGVILVSREAAGSSIPHLDPGRVKRLQIPWARADIRNSIGQLVDRAVDLRDDACEFETQARRIVESAIEDAA